MSAVDTVICMMLKCTDVRAHLYTRPTLAALSHIDTTTVAMEKEHLSSLDFFSALPMLGCHYGLDLSPQAPHTQGGRVHREELSSRTVERACFDWYYAVAKLTAKL